ncbi:type I-E CRISPR-associated protein Cse1/CasA [Nocardiopsis rhodophaea]|uniref:Type I-E CRISPR-associated protein Cse1/CasA n=1 Tax=Nocardiopsis rhodophaea TaxID=280238 RepID=A0ABN2TH18_9ACTN
MHNLVKDRWIPLKLRSGGVEEVSLRKALLESELFADAVFPAPTLLPAVLRQVLLPVIIDAVGRPRSSEEWKCLFEAGCFTEEQKAKISAYLDGHVQRFDLFSEQRPFAQVSGLAPANGETRTAALLIPSIASGNNVPLFSSVTEGDPVALRPAEAAWWLLHAHCWDTAAIKTGADGDGAVSKGKTTGNPTGPLGQLGVIVPLGTTLYETLLLNLPPCETSKQQGDRPQWRSGEDGGGKTDAASPQWGTRPELGLLDLLTWQSRRIRLIPEDTPDGIRVTRVVLCAGDRLSRIPQIEPHTAWNWTARPRKGQHQWRPRRHRQGRAIWQGLEALLAVNLPTEGDHGAEYTEVTSVLLRGIGELQVDGALPAGYPLRVAAVGMVYGNQSAVVENVIADCLPLPQSALVADDATREMVRDVAEQADALARAIDRLHADLRRASGGDPLPWDKGNHAGETLLHALDPLVRRMLAGIQRHADDDEQLEAGMAAWEAAVWEIAEQHAQRLLAAASPTTFAGREVDKRIYNGATAAQSFRAALYTILPGQAEERRRDAA